MCHAILPTDLGGLDRLREKLDLSHMRQAICVHQKGALLRRYGMQYTYLIFNLFLSYLIQVDMIDVFTPS